MNLLFAISFIRFYPYFSIFGKPHLWLWSDSKAFKNEICWTDDQVGSLWVRALSFKDDNPEMFYELKTAIGQMQERCKHWRSKFDDEVKVSF